MAWSNAQDLKFEYERSKLARNLLAQVANAPPCIVRDLNRGPGNSTELLATRFPCPGRARGQVQSRC